jgi:hypothetical protein
MALTVVQPGVGGTGATNLIYPSTGGTVMVSGNMPAFSAYQSVAQTLSSNTGTKLTFTSTDFDTTGGMYASSRFTPTVGGYYQVNSTMTWATTGTRGFLNIYKNGSAFKQGSFIGTCDAATVNALVFLNGSTDYIEIYGQLTVGQALNATSQYTYFQAAMIRGT